MPRRTERDSLPRSSSVGGTPTATGRGFEAEICDIIEGRDGRIQSLTMYADWPAMLRNFAPVG